MEPIYILLVAITALLIWQIYAWLEIHSIHKHDLILYQFCQLRRNMNRFIEGNWESLTKTEYEQYIILQDHINATISNFREIKVKYFNVKKLHQIHEDAVESSELVEKLLRNSSNEALNRLLLEYKYCVVLGFFAYTPWLREKIIAQILLSIIGDKLDVKLEWYRKQSAWISDPSHKYNPYINYQSC